MSGAILLGLTILIAARAWRAGRAADGARVVPLLVRLAAAALGMALLMAASARGPGSLAMPLAVAAGAAALVAFDALASLAFWNLRGRRAIAFRAPFAAIAVVLALLRGPWTAIAVMTALGLLSYRWRSALSTAALFRTFLGSVGLVTVLLAPLVPDAAPTPDGPLRPLAIFVRVMLSVVRVYALIGMFKVFVAFTRDPSLGIRTVGRRLALSHVLVLVVPLAITLTLWVTTTYLGVNGDRALAGRRLLEREAADLTSALRAALTAGGAEGAMRLAREREARWPGTRLWIAAAECPGRAAGLVRVLGERVEGEDRLAAWLAGLDTLPDHGVVGLRGRSWLGAAVRPEPEAGAVLLVPIGAVLDSTLGPVIGARFVIREGTVVSDSLRAFERDARALRREIAGERSAPDAQRAAGRRFRGSVDEGGPRGPRFQVDAGPRRVSLGAGDAVGLGGMATVEGPEFWDGRWQGSELILTARADLRTIVAGLFANVRENEVQVVPLVLLGLLVLLLLPVAWLDFSMVGGMGRSIAQAAAALRGGAAALGRGELRHRIEIRGQDDLWEAAGQFNRMAEDLERAREQERERDRLEHELELARRIQRRLLPEAPPVIPGLEMAGHSEPAREVGGDYFDHVDLGGGRVLLVIADVSGKGVPAALLMSGFRASLMSQDANRAGPDQLAERVNDFLHRSVDPGKFVTACFAFVEAATGRVVYANAGHNPPALRRADGRVDWLSVGGTMLGILATSRFESGEAVMGPGDLLVLYTDGVTEGANAAGELWGEARLVESLERLAALPCAAAVDSLVREVRAFEGDTGPADDITVLLVRRT
jgi:serine phosphatase RsbU (regulator of sigma subunit)